MLGSGTPQQKGTWASQLTAGSDPPNTGAWPRLQEGTCSTPATPSSQPSAASSGSSGGSPWGSNRHLPSPCSLHSRLNSASSPLKGQPAAMKATPQHTRLRSATSPAQAEPKAAWALPGQLSDQANSSRASPVSRQLLRGADKPACDPDPQSAVKYDRHSALHKASSPACKAWPRKAEHIRDTASSCKQPSPSDCQPETMSAERDAGKGTHSDASCGTEMCYVKVAEQGSPSDKHSANRCSIPGPQGLAAAGSHLGSPVLAAVDTGASCIVLASTAVSQPKQRCHHPDHNEQHCRLAILHAHALSDLPMAFPLADELQFLVQLLASPSSASATEQADSSPTPDTGESSTDDGLLASSAVAALYACQVLEASGERKPVFHKKCITCCHTDMGRLCQKSCWHALHARHLPRL